MNKTLEERANDLARKYGYPDFDSALTMDPAIINKDCINWPWKEKTEYFAWRHGSMSFEQAESKIYEELKSQTLFGKLKLIVSLFLLLLSFPAYIGMYFLYPSKKDHMEYLFEVSLCHSGVKEKLKEKIIDNYNNFSDIDSKWHIAHNTPFMTTLKIALLFWGFIVVLFCIFAGSYQI